MDPGRLSRCPDGRYWIHGGHRQDRSFRCTNACALRRIWRDALGLGADDVDHRNLDDVGWVDYRHQPERHQAHARVLVYCAGRFHFGGCNSGKPRGTSRCHVLFDLIRFYHYRRLRNYLIGS